jgi:hypothetical protein
MANISGVVEVIMTNKFNKDKIAMKLVDDDTWYGQSKEWMEVMPDRGDTVEFSGGKTGKYIQYLKILEKADGPAPAAAVKSGGKGKFNLGIELGHAANNAVQLAIAEGISDLDVIKAKTRDFYDMMKSLREEYEGSEVVQEKAPKASASKKAKPAPKDDFEDFGDDIPF